MFIFKVQIPLQLEQRSNFNTHDFSTLIDLVFSFENDNFAITGDNELYTATINNIVAKDRTECSYLVEDILTKNIKICSLLIQSQHSNQHYTHLRLNYDINKIVFINESLIADNNNQNTYNMEFRDVYQMHDSAFMHSFNRVDFAKFNELVKCYDDVSFRFIIDAFYRAINSTDVITKYFNAFSAVEFIESSFAKNIKTHKLVSEEIINLMLKSIENELEGDTYKRIKERVRNNLLRATLETRADKLLFIVNHVFKIDIISSGDIKANINLDFIQNIIDTRNALFHGKKIEESMIIEVRKITLELILLLQSILIEWNNIKND